MEARGPGVEDEVVSLQLQVASDGVVVNFKGFKVGLINELTVVSLFIPPSFLKKLHA